MGKNKNKRRGNKSGGDRGGDDQGGGSSGAPQGGGTPQGGGALQGPAASGPSGTGPRESALATPSQSRGNDRSLDVNDPGTAASVPAAQPQGPGRGRASSVTRGATGLNFAQVVAGRGRGGSETGGIPGHSFAAAVASRGRGGSGIWGVPGRTFAEALSGRRAGSQASQQQGHLRQSSGSGQSNLRPDSPGQGGNGPTDQHAEGNLGGRSVRQSATFQSRENGSQASEDNEAAKRGTEAQQARVDTGLNGGTNETPADSSRRQPRETLTIQLPPRPSYGTLGKDVRLVANSVPLKLNRDLVFYRYHIDMMRVDSRKNQQGNSSTAAASQLAAQVAGMNISQTSGGASKVAGLEAQSAKVLKKSAGMKRAHIIAKLLSTCDELRTLDKKGGLASDFRDNLITTQKLGTRTYTILYRGVRSDYRDEQYQIHLRQPEQGPSQLKMGDLLDYLRDAQNSDPGASQENTFSQVLNIWLRHFSKREETSDEAQQTVVGSKAYPLWENGTTRLKFGVETIRGYFSSVRFGEARAWVNVNVTHGAFFQDLPLKEWVRDARLKDGELHEALKGVRVRLTHRRANVSGSQEDIIKVISGLATPMDGHPEKGQPTPANPPKVPPTAPASAAKCGQVSFYDKDGKNYVTVVNHFRTTYPGHGDPGLEKDVVVNLGSRLHPEYYPMSVCHIVKGQNYRPKLRGELTSQMILEAQVPPDRSCTYITEEAFKVIGFDPRAQTAQLLDPDLTLASTKGRILLPPSVSYNQKTANVNNGTWNVNDKGRYSRGGAAAKWAVLPIGDISEHWETWKSFFQRLHGLMNRRGFVQTNQAATFLTAAPGPGEGLSREGLRTNFTKLRREGYSLLFVLLPNEQAEPYNMVKAASDIDVGIHTVCIARSKITNEKRKDPRDPTGYRYDGQYWDNILLKANLKRGGINHTLSFPTSAILSHWNAMVVGLDVTHPPPGAGAQSKSIVGMVASVGRDLAQWPATICFQPRDDMEIVTSTQCFRDLLEPHLRRYKKHNTKYPDVLIVYRDGVSEGQYNHVIDLEKPQIQTVCEEVYRADNRPPPKLSIIVVGKRHHTRFFTDEKKQNPVPGTIVDRPITHNHKWEFYLQAHKPIRGTARPAHYVVVHDEFFGPTFNNPENKANRARLGQPNHPALQNAADVLESFTHTLSYALGRSTRSIGVCTPARLADKVCDRARCYVNAGLKEPEIHIADAVKDTMFYI